MVRENALKVKLKFVARKSAENFFPVEGVIPAQENAASLVTPKIVLNV